MLVQVLGPLRVTEGDREIPLGSPQQRKLLAVLIASGGRRISTDRLIDEMWGEEPPRSARHLVHVYVSRIRKLLAAVVSTDRLVGDGGAYALRLEPGELDADVFDQSRAMAAPEPAEHGMEHAGVGLEQLLAMWRGPPYGDLRFESPLIRTDSVRLEEAYLDALEREIDLTLEVGGEEDLGPSLRRLTEEHPYRERFWCQRMICLYREGRQVEALRLGQSVRRRFHTELGLEPGPEFVTVERQILLHDGDLLVAPPAPPANIPSFTTSFIGRSEEIKRVAAALGNHRFVTLTGPGGIGKTRLAAEVANRVLFMYRHGVLWVDLDRAGDAGDVGAVVAEVCGVAASPGGSLLESLRLAFGLRHQLLVLDNCERVASDAAKLSRELLHAGQDLTILTTSRTPLRVEGETLWRVPPLALPMRDADPADMLSSDAVALFAARGQAFDPGLVIDPDTAPVVAEICRRLDGLPLAIEMAAARLRVLGPRQILAALTDRVRLLRSGADVPDRHESMEAAIEWSVRDLQAGPQRLLAALSVFAGAFDFQAMPGSSAGRRPRSCSTTCPT